MFYYYNFMKIVILKICSLLRDTFFCSLIVLILLVFNGNNFQMIIYRIFKYISISFYISDYDTYITIAFCIYEGHSIVKETNRCREETIYFYKTTLLLHFNIPLRIYTLVPMNHKLFYIT